MIAMNAVISGISIGIGCRKGCTADEIAALVRRACAQAGVNMDGARLFSIIGKEGEGGMLAAAQLLGLPLALLTAAALAEMAGKVSVRSHRVELLFGTPSVAEAAALAGAGPGAALIVPRLASARATCAIARINRETSAT